jgi:hypothetical protein
MSNFDQRLPAGWSVRSDRSEPVLHAEPATDPRWIRELDQITGTGPRQTRTVPIKMLTPLLLDAQQRNSGWLEDFAEDVVVIDADLHEVLLAYQKLQHQLPGLPNDCRSKAA